MRFCMSCSCRQRPSIAVPLLVAAGGSLVLLLASLTAAQDQRDSQERPPPEARGKGPRKAQRDSNDERPRPGPPRGPGGEGFRGPGRDFGGEGPPGFRGGDGPREMTVNKGYVFIDGEYISPPYEIRSTDSD